MVKNNYRTGTMSINSAPQSIQDINLKFIMSAPFFSEFLYRFKYSTSDKVPTIGVCAKGTEIQLVIGTGGWWDSLPEHHKEAVIVHEILHLVHETHFNSRGKSYDHRAFNIAADICINDEIENSTLCGKQMELPRPGCFLSDIKKEGYDGDVITEVIYNWLQENAEKFSMESNDLMEGEGEGKDGSGKDGSGKDGESKDEKGSGGKKVLKPFDSHKGLEEGMDEVAKATVQSITHVAKMKGFGTMSGRMEDYIRQITTHKINWRQILRSFMKSTSTGNMTKTHTWLKANRRHLPLPGKRKLSAEYVVAIDTSGSVSSEELEIFFAEIDKIAQTCKIRLVQCDTEFTDSGMYKKGDWKKVKIFGRGGTELSPIFKFMQEEHLTKSKLIVFTDGEFNYSFDTFGVDTLWALTQNGIQDEMAKAFKYHKFLVLEK